MRTLSRFLPILVGLALGYMLVSPPEWLAPLGPWRWPAVAAIVGVALLALTAYSILDGDRGGLTTGAEPGGAAIPAARGSLRQVIPRADVEQVVRRHREGLHYLRARGLAVKAVSASTFRQDFATSFRRQREAFLAAPLRGAAVTLWRAATGRTPHVGPIAQQAVARATIQELLTGTRA